jgi:hypothetical protein
MQDYFWKVFHKYYNLICIFICTPICTKNFILAKSGCYTIPVVNITQEAAVKFFQSIIYRFDVPKLVLTDNGTQFKGAKFVR